MEQRVKIAVAAGVLLVGTVVALLFRRDPPPPAAPAPATSGELILRKHVAAPPVAADPTWPPGGGCEGSQSAPAGAQEPPRAVTIVTPSETAAGPPDLARSYPDAGLPGSSRWGISMGQVLPETAAPEVAPRIHTIVDGDSLAALAERYLGAKEAAGAIFAANRDVLSDPQILPIGAELKIPAKAEDAAAGGLQPSVPSP
ncbi:MAG: LysM peptidoglycan-binding domain-containing protein [Thermoguttaceae bacterium]